MYTVDELYRVYSPQYGGNLDERLIFYKPNLIRQRGSGIGSFLLNIGRKLLPLAKKFILPHAKTALHKVATDVLVNDGNLVESLKRNSVNALKAAGKQIVSQSGSGIRRRKSKRKRSKVAVKRKRSKSVTEQPIKRKRTCKRKKKTNKIKRNLFS